MTVKENLIRTIIDMDESCVTALQHYADRLLWDNIPEEIPTEEENQIFEKARQGDVAFAPCYRLEEILSDKL